MTFATAIALAYLLGSIPTSYIVVWLATGRDVRTLGNGNPGMMNVWDNVGLTPAVVVGLGDIGKGMAAVGVSYWLGGGDTMAVICALFAVLGHDFSIFLRFHGGNGMATSVGGLFALVPAASLPAAAGAAMLFIALRTRWSSGVAKRASGLAGLLSIPALAFAGDYEPVKVVGIFLLLTVASLKIIRFEGFKPARSRPPR